MNKAILISIRPEYLVNILNGKKTLELRKTVPKDYVGWVYLYCTHTPKHHHVYDLTYVNNGVRFYSVVHHNKRSLVPEGYLNGKVVARFWFDEYEAYYFNDYQNDYRLLTSDGTIFKNATIPKEKVCLTCVSINDYGKGKILYTWHIKRLEIFDKPMELGEFGVKGPPQSWRYVWVEMNKKHYYVYYIYFQDKDLEPVYVVDWYVDNDFKGYLNGFSRYKDFAYIFTSYRQAKDIMDKIQAGDPYEKYFIGLIDL